MKFLLVAGLLIVFFLALLGGAIEDGVRQPAPCGYIGDETYYAGRFYTCTKQGWQHDPK